MIAQNCKLINDDGADTLCQILGKEAIFGKEVKEHCTVTGRRGSSAFPADERPKNKDVSVPSKVPHCS